MPQASAGGCSTVEVIDLEAGSSRQMFGRSQVRHTCRTEFAPGVTVELAVGVGAGDERRALEAQSTTPVILICDSDDDDQEGEVRRAGIQDVGVEGSLERTAGEGVNVEVEASLDRHGVEGVGVEASLERAEAEGLEVEVVIGNEGQGETETRRSSGNNVVVLRATADDDIEDEITVVSRTAEMNGGQRESNMLGTRTFEQVGVDGIEVVEQSPATRRRTRVTFDLTDSPTPAVPSPGESSVEEISPIQSVARERVRQEATDHELALLLHEQELGNVANSLRSAQSLLLSQFSLGSPGTAPSRRLGGTGGTSHTTHTGGISGFHLSPDYTTRRLNAAVAANRQRTRGRRTRTSSAHMRLQRRMANARQGVSFPGFQGGAFADISLTLPPLLGLTRLSDEYESLLALDDSVSPHRRGASDATIRSLPVTKATQEHTQERCCICLSDFEAGEDIKRLPCTHIFHVPCINSWLKRNACCPIDKVRI